MTFDILIADAVRITYNKEHLELKLIYSPWQISLPFNILAID